MRVCEPYRKPWLPILGGLVVRIGRSFRNGMMAHTVEDGSMPDPFPVSNRVKQVCVMAPTLFSLMFAAMLLLGSQSATDLMAASSTLDV